MSFVYAKCDRVGKQILWDGIRGLNHKNSTWMMVGDFNIIMHAHEKKS